jgi:hypothetical protein
VPALGDIDNDGKLEMVVPNSKMYVWDLYSSTNQADWPMFKRDAAGTSAFPSPPRMESTPNSLTVFHQAGQGANGSTTFGIQNTGGAQFSWSSNTPDGVSISPSSGSIAPGGTTMINVTVQANNSIPAGTYPLGNITINANSPEGTVINGTDIIPIKMIVGNISRSYTPVVQK